MKIIKYSQINFDLSQIEGQLINLSLINSKMRKKRVSV